jgi:hypothetical protein
MTEYTGIKGGKVQNFSSDPANPFVGQVWYNTTSSELKVRSSNASGAWTTGGSFEYGERWIRRSWYTNCCIRFWWILHLPATATGATESYNGTAWTSSPNSINTARGFIGGAGVTNTAALAFGGNLIQELLHLGVN